MDEKRTTQRSHRHNPQPIDPERHARVCAICRSENREDIEDAYLNWLGPEWISRMFTDVRDRMVLYRHAHATGLHEFRRRNLRAALDRILENADSGRVSGDCALRAIKAYSNLNNDGHWTDPVQKVFISRRHIELAVPEDPQVPVIQRTILIDTPKTVEIDVTPTKQSPNPISTHDKTGQR